VALVENCLAGLVVLNIDAPGGEPTIENGHGLDPVHATVIAVVSLRSLVVVVLLGATLGVRSLV